jgi:hypothetical protein
VNSIAFTDLRLPTLLSTAYGIAHGFVKQHFPTKPVVDVPDEPVLPPNGSEYARQRGERERGEAARQLPSLVRGANNVLP